MELQTKLQEDMKSALKAGQKDRLGVIRMLLSDVKNRDLMPGKPSESQVIEAYGKKLRKSVEEYQKLNRPQEAAQLKSELAVVEEYLPKKLSPEQTERLIDDFLAVNKFTEKDAGRAMGSFMKEHGQEVDGAAASALLRKKLSGK